MTLVFEVLVVNSGKQASYGERWRFALEIDGAETEGRAVFPYNDSPFGSLHFIDAEDFIPGKPVRGVKAFTLTGMSNECAKKYLSCDSPKDLSNVGIELSVWDSKYHRSWTQKTEWRQIIAESCREVTSRRLVATTRQDKPKPTLRFMSKDAEKALANSLKVKYVFTHPNGTVPDEMDWINRELRHQGYGFFVKPADPCEGTTMKGVEVERAHIGVVLADPNARNCLKGVKIHDVDIGVYQGDPDRAAMQPTNEPKLP